MAPRSTAAGSFASMIMSDSEPDFDDVEAIGMPSVKEGGLKVQVSKQSRIRPTIPTNRITKPAQRPGRNVKGGANPVPPVTARQILVEKSKNSTVIRPGMDRNHSDELDNIAPEKSHSKSSSTREHGRLNGAKRDRGLVHTGSTGKFYAQEAMVEHESESMDIDEMAGSANCLGQQETTPLHEKKEQLPTTYCNNTDEISTQRRLGELHQKYDSLETRHNELREVGVKAAERNFERLKRQSEENTAGEKLILQFVQLVFVLCWYPCLTN